MRQQQAARTCWVTQAAADAVELRLRGANGSIKVEGRMATMSLRTRSEELGRSAWRESLASISVEKAPLNGAEVELFDGQAQDVGSYKEATVPVEQAGELEIEDEQMFEDVLSPCMPF